MIGGDLTATPSAPDAEALRGAFRLALGVGALFILASFLFLARMEERSLHGEK
jgi:hypothetical protein